MSWKKDWLKGVGHLTESVFQVLKEVRVLVWIFMALNLPQVAFIVYLMYKVSLTLE